MRGARLNIPSGYEFLPHSKPARFALLVAVGAAIVFLCIRLWPTARVFAVEMRDAMGMDLVEGHTDAIEAASAESKVDAHLIAAVMFLESRGRGGQTSHAGAHGLMQLVPAAASDAAKRLGVEVPTVEQLLEDDELNIRLGAAHLAWLLQHRGEWNLEAVLVSYNAGRAKLFRWIDRHGGYEEWRTSEHDLHLAGERTTGTLEYATRAIELTGEFRERGAITLPGGVQPVE